MMFSSRISLANLVRVGAFVALFVTGISSALAATVFIAGDSTVMTYKAGYKLFPQQGWGARIPEYFNTTHQFANKAIGGRSSKSFVVEGRLDDILNQIKPGDFLLVQFGHNDSSSIAARHTDPQTTYKQYLRMYIDGAKAKGAVPILITPMGRRSYDSAGKFKNDFAAYTKAMKELGPEKGVHVVDLSALSIAYYNSIGVAATKNVFMFLEPGQYPNFINGASDATHFQENGANQIARLVAKELKAQNIKNLSNNVK